MLNETVRLGKRGTLVIPVAMRKKYGLKEGMQLSIEAQSEGVLLRPVVTLPVEIYTPERKAEFLLNAAITMEEYSEAVEKISEMGIDPKTIPHEKPNK